ncbi:MAG: hypothetical protein M1820_000004 [Bogoriella megaspora]|nr:MAG: hypothetical protein M1820_000004 [Bogoriella megaspora]
MPMSWDASADAKLFAAVLKIHDVRPDYQQLAAEMGPDCTPKAVQHRFATIKARSRAGVEVAGRGQKVSTPRTQKTVSTPKSDTKATTTPRRAKAAPASSSKPMASTGKKRNAAGRNKTPEYASDDGDDEDAMVRMGADVDDGDYGGAEMPGLEGAAAKTTPLRSSSRSVAGGRKMYAEASSGEDDEEDNDEGDDEDDGFAGEEHRSKKVKSMIDDAELTEDQDLGLGLGPNDVEEAAFADALEEQMFS